MVIDWIKGCFSKKSTQEHYPEANLDQLLKAVSFSDSTVLEYSITVYLESVGDYSFVVQGRPVKILSVKYPFQMLNGEIIPHPEILKVGVLEKALVINNPIEFMTIKNRDIGDVVLNDIHSDILVFTSTLRRMLLDITHFTQFRTVTPKMLHEIRTKRVVCTALLSAHAT